MKRAKLLRNEPSRQAGAPAPTVKLPSEEKWKEFFQTLQRSGTMPVMFSLMEAYNNAYIPVLARYKCVNMENYFCDSASQKTYSKLVSTAMQFVTFS